MAVANRVALGLSMPRRRADAIRLLVLAAAVACASIFLVADSGNAATALFRAKRTWWFSRTSSWTDGLVIPPSGWKSYEPPAVAYVGNTTGRPRFTAPRSFIKNTTYYFRAPPGTTRCYWGYPCSRGQYSYWNAKGSFRKSNPNAPTTTTTVRMLTTMVDKSQWSSAPPTAMYDPVTPTTTWGGRYDHSRGGSIMIRPGAHRFGGTMRFLEGPNSFYFSRGESFPDHEYYTFTFRPIPLSEQPATGVEFEIGEVEEVYVGHRYRLTRPLFQNRLVIGQTSMGGPDYYVQIVRYLRTHAPYTTGKVTLWDPNGNTSSFQTETGYDNRTPAGLNGTISLVHPRLFHVYTVFPSSSERPIEMTWSSARLRRIDFRFLPEPRGALLLASGLAMLAWIRWLEGRRARQSG